MSTTAAPRVIEVHAPSQERRWVRDLPLLPLLILVPFILAAVFADFIAPYDPVWQIDERLTPPNWDYVLGLDEFGRDVYSRIIYGARVSLYAGIVSVIFIALPVGSVLGVLGGYFRGWVDTLLSRLVDGLDQAALHWLSGYTAGLAVHALAPALETSAALA